MEYHPSSGYHYIHVIRGSEAFLEVRRSYEKAAERLPWMTTIADTDLWTLDRSLWNDPRVMFIFWMWLPDGIPEDIKAKTALHYTESTKKPRDSQYMELYEKPRASLGKVDLVFAHTPTVLQKLKPLTKQIALCPIGHEPGVLGVPEWNSRKARDIAFYGRMLDRRKWILPILQKHFGWRFRAFSRFGNERKKILEESRATLYILHAGDSGATSRLWQVAATSSAMICEKTDYWPAVPEEHYIEIERMDQENPKKFLDELERILDRKDLDKVARRAHWHLFGFTVEKVMEDFVVPASRGIQ